MIRAGIITAALAVVGSAIFRMVTTPASASGVLPEGDPRRIAVLYFDDLTPTSVPNYVVDGLTEDLIDKLGAVRALHVISPNGVRPFRGSAIPLDSIGRALKVGTIVSGSVARLGNTMRINVRLADARTGRQLYSQPIEQQWTGVFALQDQLANQVSFFLRQRLGDEIALRENRGATKSDAAWETVQLAAVDLRSATEILTTRDDPRASQLLLRPDSLYARAEQLDPTWDHPTVKRGDIALAMATQATTIPARPTSPPNGIDSVRYRRMTPSGRRVLWLQRAIELGDSAVRRSPRSAEALSLRGDARYRLAATDARAYDTLARLAERDLRAAIDLRPDAARAWSILASIGIDQGRFAEAAEAAERAYEADAFFEQRRIVSTAFFAALHSDQFDKARRWCRIGLQHYAGDPRFAECELTLLGWTGRTRRDAAAAWRTLTRIEQGDTQQMLGATWGYRRLMVAAVLARSGQRDSVRSLLAATIGEQRRDPTKRGHPLGKAYVHLLLNERDSAVAQLRDYVRALPRARTLIGAHPWFRTLKGDPRFDELVQPTR